MLAWVTKALEITVHRVIWRITSFKQARPSKTAMLHLDAPVNSTILQIIKLLKTSEISIKRSIDHRSDHFMELNTFDKNIITMLFSQTFS